MKQLRQIGLTAVFAGVIFLGAFLLFQVQPLIGRYLLPWFGGTPEVWTTCMLFFQIFLLAGYAYAHYLLRLKRRQAVIHLIFIALSILFLPVFPHDSFKPVPGDNPILKILLICAATVGLPYLVLSATSPLVQGWFARAMPGRNPYRLYALSNAGSLLALASFPFIFEPMLTRGQTVYVWSIGFAVFAAICALAALLAHRNMRPLSPSADGDLAADELNRCADTPGDTGTPAESPLNKRILFLWIALPAAASVELLAITNKITQDIAVIPFLWVLPLGLYLLSFIISFEHQRWYQRWLWVPLFIIGIIGVIYARMYEGEIYDIRILIGLYLLMLFSCCMVCHGEVYRLRPPVQHLTAFYLLISVGGALGGFFVAVIAPLIFNVYIELWLGLLAAAMFLLIGENTDLPKASSNQTNPSIAVRRRRKWLAAGLVIVGAVGILFMGQRSVDHQRSVENTRNFFGVLTVWEEAWDNPQEHKLLLQHGTTFHGLQFLAPEKRAIPTAYYSPESGVGLVMRHFQTDQPRRIGIVGLGVGTLAVYGQPRDTIRFYEINRDVEKLARKYFTYLKDSAARVDVVLGDARLTMENEPPQAYDVLVLDAFSSDAVPLHLLTKEAMEIYLGHLRPGGVLAFHISTMHLDLHSVVWRLADEFALNTAWIEGFEDESAGGLASDWILLSREDAFLQSDVIASATSRPGRRRKEVMLWTDDHMNILEILKKSL